MTLLRPVDAHRFATVLALSAAVGFSFTSPSQAGSKKWVLEVDKGSGAVTFDAIGKPSAIKIHGKGDAPKGELEVVDGKLNGSCVFQLDSLDTGIKLRNDHMKKRYLQVDQHPQAKLTFTNSPLPEKVTVDGFSADEIPFKGLLALHGVEKPVEGKAKVSRKGELMSVEASFGVKTTDFNIAVPTFAGVTMGEKVDIQAKITAPFHAN